jgi:hypothetical protein
MAGRCWRRSCLHLCDVEEGSVFCRVPKRHTSGRKYVEKDRESQFKLLGTLLSLWPLLISSRQGTRRGVSRDPTITSFSSA